MSQKKVDQYKEFKKNREKIYVREKKMKQLRLILASVLAVLVIGWFGYSIYNTATRPPESEDGTVTPVEVDYNAYNEYLADLKTGY